MNRHPKGIALVILCLFAMGCAPDFRNEPEGFMGYKWGSSVDAIPGIVPAGYSNLKGDLRAGNQPQEREPLSAYRKISGEIWEYSGQPVASVTYIYWRGKLVAGMIDTPPYGRGQVNRIRDELSLTHGKWRKKKDIGGNATFMYGWEGPKTTINLTHFLTGRRLAMYSTELFKERENILNKR